MANRRVNLSVEEKSIHAIVGENGAGKTTLMKIVYGLETPQEGKIYYKGTEVTIKNTADAIKLGIGMVQQNMRLAPHLTVAENLVLGIEPRKRKFLLDMKRAISLTTEISGKFGLPIDPNSITDSIPIGVKQRLELLKALARNATVLILDEPTSVLTPQEVDVLFETLEKLKDAGKTIVFISHKLKEVKRIADVITVMRDGRIIETTNAGVLDESEIARIMVGRNVTYERAIPAKNIGEELLSVEQVGCISDEGQDVLHDVSLSVRSGEIVGLAGVQGNGQTELVEILTGIRRATSGRIRVKGKDISGLSPRATRQHGVSHIPEDRIKDGIAENASVEENIVADRYYRAPFSSGPFLSWRHIGDHCARLIADFNILAHSPRMKVAWLSGGNIQKVVVARELSSDPSLIIANQPTRGIDVGSEQIVEDLLIKARDKGCGILLVSADLDQILKISTRIVVMFSGKIVARFEDTEGIGDKDIGPYMLGVTRTAV